MVECSPFDACCGDGGRGVRAERIHSWEVELAGQIEVKPYRFRLATPYRWAKGEQIYRVGLIVRADIDGAIGWGESAFAPHVEIPGEAWAQACRGLVAGLDPGAEDFLEQLQLRECPPRLRCGIVTAVLSARARAVGESLAKYVTRGALPLPAEVPVNELIGDADPAVCVQRAQAAMDRGQTTVKLKCTPERELDLARVGAVRAAFPAIKIRLDPNESWQLRWAAEHLNAMARFNIEYCEEPLPRNASLGDYANLRAKTRVPIALDDSVRSIYHLARILEMEAADFVILKAQRVGGPDRLFEMVQLVENAGQRCTVTASLESALGLYLGLQCAAMTAQPILPAGIGTGRFFAENVGEPPPIVNGAMKMPTEPGLGFEPLEWWARAPST